MRETIETLRKQVENCGGLVEVYDTDLTALLDVAEAADRANACFNEFGVDGSCNEKFEALHEALRALAGDRDEPLSPLAKIAKALDEKVAAEDAKEGRAR